MPAYSYTADIVDQLEANASPVQERDLNWLSTDRSCLRDPEVVIHPQVNEFLQPEFQILVRHRDGKGHLLSTMHTQRGARKTFASSRRALAWAKAFGIPVWFAGNRLAPGGIPLNLVELPTSVNTVY